MIQLTKPILVAAFAGVVAICAIAVAAFRLTTTPAPPPASPAAVSEAPAAPPAKPAGPGASVAVAPATPSAPGAHGTLPSPGAVAPAPGATGAPATSGAGASKPAAEGAASIVPSPPAAPKPSFDVVRIDPTGDAVVAGRSEPRAQVALMLSGKPVAQAQADADGQFVMLPPNLPPGDHVLALRATGANGEVVSEQTVTIAVPQRGARETVAALAAPNKPTVVLSQPAAPAGSSPQQLHISSVEALQGGAMFASGAAPAGANLRLYLNESYIASVEAGADGKWSVRVERGMSPGAYRVRADRVGPDGRAIGRVEAPFDYPAELARQVAAAAATVSGGANSGARPEAPASPQTSPRADQTPPVGQTSQAGQSPQGGPATQTADRAPQAGAIQSPQAGALATASAGAGSSATATATPSAAPAASPVSAPPAASAQNAVVSDLRTARVERGDSLWRISTSIYGEGIRYTQIYDANTSQIRDPDLIYPGQVLVVPKQEENTPAARERRR